MLEAYQRPIRAAFSKRLRAFRPDTSKLMRPNKHLCWSPSAQRIAQPRRGSRLAWAHESANLCKMDGSARTDSRSEQQPRRRRSEQPAPRNGAHDMTPAMTSKTIATTNSTRLRSARRHTALQQADECRQGRHFAPTYLATCNVALHTPPDWSRQWSLLARPARFGGRTGRMKFRSGGSSSSILSIHFSSLSTCSCENAVRSDKCVSKRERKACQRLTDLVLCTTAQRRCDVAAQIEQSRLNLQQTRAGHGLARATNARVRHCTPRRVAHTKMPPQAIAATILEPTCRPESAAASTTDRKTDPICAFSSSVLPNA